LAIAACLLSPVAVHSAADEKDCGDYYFGISSPPDFHKALRCYEREQAWDFLILMYLNGEGTPVDLHKAEDLLKDWQKAGPAYGADSLQAAALRKAIEERKQNPDKTYPHLDYCTDVAGDTVAINFCAGIDDQIAERDFKLTMAATKAKLTRSEAIIFDRMIAAFTAFKRAESRRMYLQYIDGTIRGVAAMEQAAFVRDQFLALIRDAIEHHALEPADDRAYKTADDELNQVYRNDVREYAQGFEDRIREDSFKDFRDLYRGYIADYKKAAREVQIHWIQYRDLWAELARSLYKDRGKALDAAVSMKTAVTKIRVKELRNDPIGPG